MSTAVMSRPSHSDSPAPAQHQDLWSEYNATALAAKEATKALFAAIDLLPAWAQSGPEYILSDGTFGGHSVGWPADLTIEPPDNRMAVRLVRRSLTSIFDEFNSCCRGVPVGSKYRLACRRRLWPRVRRWIELRRAQKAEEAKLEIDKLHAVHERAADAHFKVTRAIELQRGRDAQFIAGRVYLLVLNDTDRDQAVWQSDDRLVSILCDLHPVLTGALAENVRELLAAVDDPAEPTFATLSVWF